MTAGGTGSVVRFYETHPINEQQILHKLDEAGLALAPLSEDELKEHDQDHFGGLEAVDVLARQAGIDARSHVLDVCSGVGGPARYLAHCLGCRVTGLDITPSRHEAAVRLTRRVGLDHLVDFRLGNALDMPFADGTFDVVIGQEAFAHVPDKPQLIRECARVAKHGGTIAFTDIVRRPALGAEAEARLRSEMTFFDLETPEGYAWLLAEAGCIVLEAEDLGERWTVILRRRLEMYRSFEETTVAKFGRVHFEKWDEAYAHFVGLFGIGQLSGVRIVARRNPAADAG